MNFTDLMNENKSMFESWKNDSDIMENYESIEDLQKDFIACIQQKISSEFIILTISEFADAVYNG